MPFVTISSIGGVGEGGKMLGESYLLRCFLRVVHADSMEQAGSRSLNGTLADVLV